MLGKLPFFFCVVRMCLYQGKGIQLHVCLSRRKFIRVILVEPHSSIQFYI